MTNENKKERFCLAICRGILMLTVVSAVFMIKNMTAQAAGDVAINEENFPDNLFRDYVTEKFDVDQNGLLSENERLAVRQINFYRAPFTSVKGVEFFPNLQTLSLMYSKIAEVDISQNSELTSLNVSHTYLTSLDVSRNVKLRELECCGLTLSGLDLHNNKELEELCCYVNEITELDLSENTHLTWLNCGRLQLKELNLQNNTKLKHLECGCNSLTWLDVSCCPELEFIECMGNQLSSLDVSNNGKLKTLECGINPLTSLSLGTNPKLSTLDCTINLLEELDVKTCTELKYLCCGYSALTQLDVSKNKSLVALFCPCNNIESLNLRGLTHLKKIDIRSCPLNVVDISYNPYLIASYKRADDLIRYSGNTTFITDQYENPFSDVTLGKWYDPMVRYVYLEGYMIGKGTKFGVADTLTRQEFTQVLYNIAGKPEVTIENTYEDVVPGAWYEKSVLWAREAGIAKGKIDGVFFGIDQEITREEMIQMLYAFLKWRGDSDSIGYFENTIMDFQDSDRVSSWAQNAMDWAIMRGIISGKGNAGAPASEKLIDPQGHATRAECATIIMSYFIESNIEYIEPCVTFET